MDERSFIRQHGSTALATVTRCGILADLLLRLHEHAETVRESVTTTPPVTVRETIHRSRTVSAETIDRLRLATALVIDAAIAAGLVDEDTEGRRLRDDAGLE